MDLPRARGWRLVQLGMEDRLAREIVSSCRSESLAGPTPPGADRLQASAFRCRLAAEHHGRVARGHPWCCWQLSPSGQSAVGPAGPCRTPCRHVLFSGGPYACGTPSPWPGHTHRHPCASAAEANAISETTETLHLSPQVAPEYVGPGAPREPEVCERSCEELGTMMAELAGLRVVVTELHENLRKVVGAGGRGRARGRGAGTSGSQRPAGSTGSGRFSARGRPCSQQTHVPRAGRRFWGRDHRGLGSQGVVRTAPAG